MIVRARAVGVDQDCLGGRPLLPERHRACVSRTLLGMLEYATITRTMDTYSHVLPGMGDVAATALEEALL